MGQLDIIHSLSNQLVAIRTAASLFRVRFARVSEAFSFGLQLLKECAF